MREKLISASEITAKMDLNTYNVFRKLIDNYSKRYLKMKNVVSKVSEVLSQNKNLTDSLSEKMRDVYLRKEKLYRFQLFSMERNFLRVFEAMEERTLTNVANSFAEMGLTVERRILRLVNETEMRNESRHALYELIMDVLETRQQICHLAKENISDFVSSYSTGTPIFSYQFEDFPQYLNYYIVPKPLLNYSLHYNSYMQEHLPRLQTSTFEILDRSLEMLKELAFDAYQTRTVNKTQLSFAVNEFFDGCREFKFSKSVVYTYGITLPLREIAARKATFDEAYEDFEAEVSEIKQHLWSLRSSIDNITADTVPRLDELFNIIDMYSPEGDVTLLELESILMSNDAIIITNTLQNFFREVSSRGQMISDLLNMLRKPISTMWRLIIRDEDSIEYYEKTKNDLFLRNLTEVLQEWNKLLNEQKSADIRSVIFHQDEEYFLALEDISKHIKAFSESMTIDSNFIK